MDKRIHGRGRHNVVDISGTIDLTRLARLEVGSHLRTPAKVPLDAPEGALEHIAHLAALQMPEPLPAKLGALLVPGAIEDDHVQMRVEA